MKTSASITWKGRLYNCDTVAEKGGILEICYISLVLHFSPLCVP